MVLVFQSLILVLSYFILPTHQLFLKMCYVFLLYLKTSFLSRVYALIIIFSWNSTLLFLFSRTEQRNSKYSREQQPKASMSFAQQLYHPRLPFSPCNEPIPPPGTIGLDIPIIKLSSFCHLLFLLIPIIMIIVMLVMLIKVIGCLFQIHLLYLKLRLI